MYFLYFYGLCPPLTSVLCLSGETTITQTPVVAPTTMPLADGETLAPAATSSSDATDGGNSTSSPTVGIFCTSIEDLDGSRALGICRRINFSVLAVYLVNVWPVPLMCSSCDDSVLQVMDVLGFVHSSFTRVVFLILSRTDAVGW